MKFKVGDKVRVKKDLSSCNCEFGITGSMIVLQGKTVIITQIEQNSCSINEDDGLFFWTDDCFEDDVIVETSDTEEKSKLSPYENALIGMTQSDATSVFGLPNLSKEEIEINRLNNQIDDLKKQIENQNMLIDYLKGEIH